MKIRLLLCLAACLLAKPAGAAVAVSNLANPSNAGSDFIQGGLFGINWHAQSFTTGSGVVDLQYVTLKGADEDMLTGDFVVELYSDSSGLPGAALESLDGADPGALGFYDFAPSNPLTLAASTTYWVVAHVESNDFSVTYSWKTTLDQSETGLPGWSLGDVYYARHEGFFGNSPWGPGGAGDRPLYLEVSVAAVPEASSLLAIPVAVLISATAVWTGRRLRFGRMAAVPAR